MREKSEGERIERGDTPTPPVLAPDPTGENDIFIATGIIPFDAPLKDIFTYVENRAQLIGSHVKANRGNPSTAKPENMLSKEEKALVILGRAIGVTWREILSRLCNHRIENGLVPPDRRGGTYHTSVIMRHREIVTAIHTDMLDSIEVFSPLIGGSQRIIWRAKLIEFYRQRIFALGRSHRLKLKEKESRIMALDKAMEKHIRFFDSLQREEDIERLMGSPADQVHSQSKARAEKSIQNLFDDGEITDQERIDQLRKLRHGDVE